MNCDARDARQRWSTWTAWTCRPLGHPWKRRSDARRSNGNALARLKPEEREAIIGRVEMDYTYEELADALGTPTPDTARKAAQRALLRLAEEMKRE